MIRLDHHNAPLSPNPKQNPDQKIISWDESRFVQEQGPVVVDGNGNGSDDNDNDNDQPVDTDKQPDPSPRNGNTPSHDLSSPLSPLPQMTEEEAPLEILQREEEEEDDPAATRQSTPLSELSPAPEEQEEQEEIPTEADQSLAQNALAEPTPAPSSPQNIPSSNPSVPPDSPSSTLPPKPPTPTTTTSPATEDTTQTLQTEALLNLNGELLKVLMLLPATGIAPSDSRFQQYNSRLESNLGWLAFAAEASGGQPGNSYALPILEPPSFILPGSDRIKQIYSQLPALFAKDLAKRQHLVRNSSASSTNLSMPGTPVLGGAGPPTGNLKRERPDDIVVDGMINKRRDMGEGKSTSVPPTPSAGAGMMPPPSAIPLSAQNSGNGSTHFSQTIPSSNSAGNMNGNNMNPSHHGHQQMQHRQSPLQQLSPRQQQHQQMQPPPRPSSSMSSSSASTPLGPPSNLSQMDANLNMPGIGINNPSDAQMAAASRERARQMQIRMAQAQAQAHMRAGGGPGGMDQGRPGGMMTPQQQAQYMQQQRQIHMQQQIASGGGVGMGGMDGSPTSGGMMGAGTGGAMGMGAGAGGSGGANLGMGQNPGMMNGMANTASGSGLPSGPQRGNSMSLGGAGMPPQQHMIQQMVQVLNTPGHPFTRYMIQSVPNFETMTTQQQVQQMIMAKNAVQNSRQQGGMGQPQQGSMVSVGGMGRGSAPMPNSMQSAHMQQQINAAGGGMSPQQHGGGVNFPAGNLTNPMSPVQQQSPPNSIFGMGGGMGGQPSSGMGMGGNPGMGNSGVNMGMGGVGSMDPRMMSNVGGMAMGSGAGGGSGPMSQQQISQQQRQLLLMQQQQRASASGGNPGMQMGGPGSGAGSVGMNMGGMGAGNIASMPMMQQQMIQERMRQQQKSQMNASSPTHSGSPIGPDFAGSAGGQSMRSGSAIPGIARSTRSPSDSAPSSLTSRGAGQRSASLSQDDYQRMLLQQQQQQATRAMSSQSPAFNQQMMGTSQQAAILAAHQQQQQGGQGGSNFSMSPPNSGSAQFGNGGISAPSPTNSTQSWNTPGGPSSYPFTAGSPAASDHARHMSATPAPQQSHITPQNTPPSDQMISNEFELFNWNT